MNKLDSKKREQVIAALIEGCSIRSIVRMTAVAKKTVLRLVIEVGAVCSAYQDRVFRNLSCRRLQVDELWGYIGAKEKNLTTENVARGAVGDIWLWVAVDAETKIVPSWTLGDRSAATAYVFLKDLASRLN